ncbi:Rha-like transcriptional regulator [Mycobacterium phage Phabba]|uniref:Antirepressor n=1 Tax=Mycobacterium phage Phabba TaxID=2027899 RepID=A0A249XSL1_9CAUD|nr:Rha-like transcriptional regulator [Mycobacterium phage Phabba]ASZ74723.1 antirepressor [Mycobacterium phage Phabba]
MGELVYGVDDTPVTTSLLIAKGTKTEHASVIRLVRENIDDLNEVGNSGFEIQNREGAGRPTEYAVLDEPAATLLMTYMRNTDVVRDVKKRLVKEFYAMRQVLEAQRSTVALPSRKELAQMVLQAEEALEIEQAARVEAEQYAQLMQGPAEAWLELAEAHGDYSMNDASHILNADRSISTGETRLRNFMLGNGWIRYTGWGREKHLVPYQTQVDNGRLFNRPGRVYWDDAIQANRQGNPQVRVTMKGIRKLHELLGGSEPVQFMAIVRDADAS